MSRKHLSCTSILIGKDATVDGSTIIARNEDYYGPVGPKIFTVRKAMNIKNNVYISPITHVKVPLPSHAYRYTCEPSTCELDYEHLAHSKYPVYEEAGINEKNIAMSATETTFSNQRFLGCDPLVKQGINEDCMITVVLPYINSAREGVKRLGHLIEKYGTGQSNGISFSDKNEIWYLETAGGHHWAAVRIPDDSYAIAPNQINIQKIDFSDVQHKNYMWSKGLDNFVKENHLNTNPNDFNFRNIAGTHTEQDSHYNTPRAWYGHYLFSPEQMKKLRLADEPTSQKIPFIMRPERKLTVEDAEYFLSSHYQGTKYDPCTHKDLLETPVFRPIAIDRNQVSHILQIRNNVPASHAAIEWVAMGFFAYSPYVPFFTNINSTPKNYQIAGHRVTLKSAYWLYKTIPALVEPHYPQFISLINNYRKDCQVYADHQIKLIDKKADGLTGNQLTELLTKLSDKTANHITQKTHELIGKLIVKSLHLSKLTYDA